MGVVHQAKLLVDDMFLGLNMRGLHLHRWYAIEGTYLQWKIDLKEYHSYADYWDVTHTPTGREGFRSKNDSMTRHASIFVDILLLDTGLWHTLCLLVMAYSRATSWFNIYDTLSILLHIAPALSSTNTEQKHTHTLFQRHTSIIISEHSSILWSHRMHWQWVTSWWE